MDHIAIYLWLVKILSLCAGVRHYTQHSDVEAVSWMTNISGFTLYIAYIGWHSVEFILQQNDILRLYLLSLLQLFIYL